MSAPPMLRLFGEPGWHTIHIMADGWGEYTDDDRRKIKRTRALFPEAYVRTFHRKDGRFFTWEPEAFGL
ncbi:MAG TPA: hypothetical protein VGG64_22330 [Pirellulales bacterium]